MKKKYKTKENERLRKSKEFKEWRKSVFERDEYRCTKCSSNKDLHPHHIKAFAKYPELRFDLDNGITLCSECHGKEHGLNFSKLGRYVTCKICAKRFRPKSGRLKQKTCSKECGYKYRFKYGSTKKGKEYKHLQDRITKKCLTCKKEFEVVVGKQSQVFCSRECIRGKLQREDLTGLKATNEKGEKLKIKQ